jgi:hypothetical protein
MTGQNRLTVRQFVVTGLVLCLFAATLPVSTTGLEDDTPEESLRIDLQADGDATVTLVVTENISEPADREAFDELNVTAKAQQFEQRMQRIVDRMAAETGRNTTVSSAEATVETTGETGVIRLSVTWTKLAVTEDEQLVVAEPFASGFRPDRPLVLTVPEGYSITQSSVSPARTDGAVARWSSGTDLTGFSTTVTANGSTGDSVPTGLVPALALVFASGLFTRVYRTACRVRDRDFGGSPRVPGHRL